MAHPLPDPISALIREEQARQNGLFVEHVDLDAYLAKLAERAEIVSDCMDGRCRGLVAYYCNDLATRQAFITLVLVAPADRGAGLGTALVGCVLNIARQRGFASCRLEVARRNQGAFDLYRAQGFGVIDEGADRYLLEIGL